MSGDVGAEVAALAEIIWNTSRADESTISAAGANIVARAILNSDWLAERVEAAKAEALLEAADCANGPLGLSRDSHVGGDWLDGACDVIDWLRVRANDTQGRAVTGDVWAYGPNPSPEWIDFCVRAAKAEAWDEGHRAPKRYGPDDCKCGAYNESECGCGEYGSNVITPNPYRAADHDPEEG